MQGRRSSAPPGGVTDATTPGCARPPTGFAPRRCRAASGAWRAGTRCRVGGVDRDEVANHIRHGEPDIATGRDWWKAASKCFIDIDALGSEAQLPAARHRISSVHCKVEQDVFELSQSVRIGSTGQLSVRTRSMSSPIVRRSSFSTFPTRRFKSMTLGCSTCCRLKARS